jgi:hypothetical protein
MNILLYKIFINHSPSTVCSLLTAYQVSLSTQLWQPHGSSDIYSLQVGNNHGNKKCHSHQQFQYRKPNT